VTTDHLERPFVATAIREYVQNNLPAEPRPYEHVLSDDSEPGDLG
jgi:hypothetical protein